jgi:hypothetical protein
MHDDAWNVEWGNLRPLFGSMGAWHPVQRFGGSCHKEQEQSISEFHDQQAESDEDEYEPDQTAYPESLLELPSIGSKDHVVGECKRCAFFFKGRCRNGKDCSHCHLPHDQTRRKRNRRRPGAGSVQVEDTEEYEGDLDDDVDVTTQPPTTKVALTLVGTPVSMPAKMSCQGFDAMLVFGTVTPEMQPQVGCATSSSSLKVVDQDDEEAFNTPAVAFGSLWNVTEKSLTVVEDSDEEAPTIVEDSDEESMEQMVKQAEAEAARLEEEALAAENEAQRLLEEAVAAEKEQNVTKKPKECMSSPPACFSSYYQANILPSCSNAYWASLYASFRPAAGVPASDDVRQQSALARKHKQSPVEAETTASSEEQSSDAGATGHDFSSSCSDKASSDSDLGSPEAHGKNPKAPLSAEVCSQRQERRHRQTHKQVSDAVRSSKRSPLWPSCLPTAGPADTPITKAAAPSQQEPKKEKTSWAALARARRQAAAEDPEVAVVRQARGILNKLTDANFETLYMQLLGCDISTATQLEAVILEIFEKATAQHGFLPMYVELCVRLNSHFEKHPIDGADFRKVLVGACQRTFEKTLRAQPQVDPSLCYEDRYEIELKFKTRMLGNLRFVGELLVRKLLAGKVLLAVSEELLSGGDAASIEAAATLLTVAGPAFDRKSWVFVPRLHAIFSMIRCMTKDKAIPLRVRCILKDLTDLRDAGWQKL